MLNSKKEEDSFKKFLINDDIDFSWKRSSLIFTEDSKDIQKIVKFLPGIYFDNIKIIQNVRKKSKSLFLKKYASPRRLWLGLLYENELKSIFNKYRYLLRKKNEKIGLGIFSLQNISEETFLGQYSGIVKKRKRFLIKNSDYLLRYSIENVDDKEYVIDAKEYGNFSRFINHSQNPNVEIRTIVLDNIIYKTLFSIKKIKEKEELLLDYGSQYWRQIKFQPETL